MIITGNEIIYPKDVNRSRGGTELLGERLFETFGASGIFNDFQIVLSRANPKDLDESKIRILWLHDLPRDPASDALLNNGGHEKFHKIVFVSNWQMQNYIGAYNIPWSKCIVIANSIVPIEDHKKPDSEKLKFIYTSTPHRGLEILVPVFKKLAEKYDNIELDVYSSFKLYGWDEQDKRFEKLYDECRNHDKINYHGSVLNDQIREALKEAHIFAYPSIWQETSCLCLIEAMSAGCLCVHSNLGALYETASNWTFMYHIHEDNNAHAQILYSALEAAINNYNEEVIQNQLLMQKTYIKAFNSWEQKQNLWKAMLEDLKENIKDCSFPKPYFHYKV